MHHELREYLQHFYGERVGNAFLTEYRALKDARRTTPLVTLMVALRAFKRYLEAFEEVVKLGVYDAQTALRDLNQAGGTIRKRLDAFRDLALTPLPDGSGTYLSPPEDSFRRARVECMAALEYAEDFYTREAGRARMLGLSPSCNS